MYLSCKNKLRVKINTSHGDNYTTGAEITRPPSHFFGLSQIVSSQVEDYGYNTAFTQTRIKILGLDYVV
jgi:hypothetical protein